MEELTPFKNEKMAVEKADDYLAFHRKQNHT
jgi:hypothetical protein